MVTSIVDIDRGQHISRLKSRPKSPEFVAIIQVALFLCCSQKEKVFTKIFHRISMVPMSCVSHFRNFSITSERNLSSFCSSINKKTPPSPISFHRTPFPCASDNKQPRQHHPPYHSIEHLPCASDNKQPRTQGGGHGVEPYLP
jgi:hypothetical protein